MTYLTPNFTKDMLDDYTILIPNMAPVQFRVIQAALESEKYHVELLQNSGSQVAELGLKYVHNDTCYPALLVIGQFLDALNSGKYDLHHTALLITQSGGGCRASNYIKLLRKALVKAGYDYIPVASFNPSGLEKNSQMPVSIRLLRKLLAALEYGDMLDSLVNQMKPYEVNKGSSEKWCDEWINTIKDWFNNNSHYSIFSMRNVFKQIAKSTSQVEIHRTNKVKVGVVGEIYVKFSPMGNNELKAFLESQDCEVNMPGVMGYVEYCIANFELDIKYYGGKKSMQAVWHLGLKLLDSLNTSMRNAMEKYGFVGPGSFKKLMEGTDGVIHLGAKMGEGWLLSGEMIELIKTGYPNIICAQPFGCLPNHIMGKGVVNVLREKYPESNISAIDYDPSATRVNQENRIKLMLAVAKENMQKNGSFKFGVDRPK